MNEKRIIILVVVLSIAIIGFWAYNESKPKPGAQFEDEGREHVPVGTQVNYKTNPPTSGNHYAEWTKWGVYQTPRDDRNLLHSLEHGYIIMSYNCDIKSTGFNLIPTVMAQDPGRPMQVASESAQANASAAATLSDNFQSADCQQLVKDLTGIYDARGQTRLIVIPRPNMDARIILTAWRYMEKLDNFNKDKINAFISGHINQGPEKTME